MEWKLIFLLIPLILWNAHAQQNDTTPTINLDQAVNTQPSNSTDLDTDIDILGSSVYPYIVSLQYRLNVSRIPELFTELALRNLPPPYLSNGEVTLANIWNAIELDQFPPADLAASLSKIKLNPADVYNILLIYNVTQEDVEGLLTAFGISIWELYVNCIRADAGTNTSTLSQAFELVNVSIDAFRNALLLGDDVALQVLSTGNYSEYNLQKALDVLDVSGERLAKIIPLSKIAQALQAGKINDSYLVGFLKNLGLNTKDFLQFYSTLNVTPVNFYTNPYFINELNYLFKLLNPQSVLGVVTSGFGILTANVSQLFPIQSHQTLKPLLGYSTFTAEVVENPLASYEITDTSGPCAEYKYGELSRLVTTTKVNEAELAVLAEPGDYGEFNKNCTYITRSELQMLQAVNVANIAVNQRKIVVGKDGFTQYVAGSPLVCDGKVYGIAESVNASHLQFSTFYRESPGNSTNIIQDSSATVPHDILGLVVVLICMIIII